VLRDAVVGELAEDARLRREPAGEEERGLVEREVVIAFEVRAIQPPAVEARWILRRIGVREARHHHRCNRNRRPIRHRQRIAAELERDAEVGELRSEAADVAGRARLVGLAGETRDGRRGARGQQEHRGECDLQRGQMLQDSRPHWPHRGSQEHSISP